MIIIIVAAYILLTAICLPFMINSGNFDFKYDSKWTTTKQIAGLFLAGWLLTVMGIIFVILAAMFWIVMTIFEIEG